MKNIVLFICCLITHITVYCMEKENQNESCQTITHQEREKILIDDCKSQLKKCLEAYKVSDEFKPQDMENILEGLFFITNNSDNSIDYIHCTKDDEMNGFFQYALKKTDWLNMQWLIAKGNIKHHSEKEYADFIAFCNEQLSPTVEQSKRDIAYIMLKSIIEYYKTNTGFLTLSSNYYLNIMIMLQLKHRALESNFSIEEDLLIPFVQQNQTCNPNVLSDLYQTIVDVEDRDSNTLAHIVAEQRDADELHKLMNKNYISKEARNSGVKTVLDLAFDKYRVFTQNPKLKELEPQNAQAALCCYRMLDKYFSEDDFDKKKNCCDKHPVLKRYGLDFLKNSPSTSVSPSVSASVSSSSELPASLEKAKVLADDPADDDCCAQIIRYFQKKSLM